MKRLKMLCIVALLPLLMHAQSMNSEVSVTINGNKNLQISLDGKTFDFNARTNTGNVTAFSMNNLSLGEHVYLISRTDNSTNTTEKITAIVNLRYGYDMTLVLNEDGSLELIESRKDGYTSVSRQPIGDAPFNTLLQRVRIQKSTAARRAIVAAAFDTPDNFFSTLQVEQLLRQINAESFRLGLAKAAFGKVTDPFNFGSIFSLLASEASRKNLDAYITAFERKPETADNMVDAEFKRLYLGIQQQWSVSARMNVLTTTFDNSNNYFTTSQAAQLIQLVTTESDRLKLAKASYPNITDKANFNQIFELLNTQNSRNELDNHIKSQGGTTTGGGTTASNPMSETNFANLFNAVQNQWPASTQMNTLNDVFNNTNNFFSTYQAVQLIKLVAAESNRLQLAKASYRNIIDKANFNQIFELLNTQNSRNELDNHIKGQGVATVGGGTTANNAMSETNFANLFNAVQNQWPASTQINTLNDVFNNTNNFFSTYQAVQLIKLVAAESNRLQLSKAAYRNITDKANFGQVSDLLNTQNSKNELLAYVRNSGTTEINANAKQPLSDANFNRLYQTIQMQFLPFERMSAITDFFNNAPDYLSTSQAKQLIELTTSENNRLTLAKLSYKKITDRNNFSQLFDILPTQAYKVDLANFVRAYRD